MTYKERLKLLQELKKQPLSISLEKPEQVEEALNWAIKICHKFVSRQESKNHGLGGYCE